MFHGIRMRIRLLPRPQNDLTVRSSESNNHVRNGGYDPWLSRIRNCVAQYVLFNSSSSRSYFNLDVTVQLSAGLDRPARYGRALVGVGNFRGIIFAEAVVSAKTAKFKSHEI